MFNLIPLHMLFSFLLWASVIYTFIGCLQMLLINSMAKREEPKAKTYFDFSIKNRKAILKAGIKTVLGLLSLIVLAIVDHYMNMK